MKNLSITTLQEFKKDQKKITDWIQSKEKNQTQVLLIKTPQLVAKKLQEIIQNIVLKKVLIISDDKSYPLSDNHKILIVGEPLNLSPLIKKIFIDHHQDSVQILDAELKILKDDLHDLHLSLTKDSIKNYNLIMSVYHLINQSHSMNQDHIVKDSHHDDQSHLIKKSHLPKLNYSTMAHTTKLFLYQVDQLNLINSKIESQLIAEPKKTTQTNYDHPIASTHDHPVNGLRNFEFYQNLNNRHELVNLAKNKIIADPMILNPILAEAETFVAIVKQLENKFNVSVDQLSVTPLGHPPELIDSPDQYPALRSIDHQEDSFKLDHADKSRGEPELLQNEKLLNSVDQLAASLKLLLYTENTTTHFANEKNALASVEKQIVKPAAIIVDSFLISSDALLSHLTEFSVKIKSSAEAHLCYHLSSAVSLAETICPLIKEIKEPLTSCEKTVKNQEEFLLAHPIHYTDSLPQTSLISYAKTVKIDEIEQKSIDSLMQAAKNLSNSLTNLINVFKATATTEQLNSNALLNAETFLSSSLIKIDEVTKPIIPDLPSETDSPTTIRIHYLLESAKDLTDSFKSLKETCEPVINYSSKNTSDELMKTLQDAFEQLHENHINSEGIFNNRYQTSLTNARIQILSSFIHAIKHNESREANYVQQGINELLKDDHIKNQISQIKDLLKNYLTDCDLQHHNEKQ